MIYFKTVSFLTLEVKSNLLCWFYSKKKLLLYLKLKRQHKGELSSLITLRIILKVKELKQYMDESWQIWFISRMTSTEPTFFDQVWCSPNPVCRFQKRPYSYCTSNILEHSGCSLIIPLNYFINTPSPALIYL